MTISRTEAALIRSGGSVSYSSQYSVCDGRAAVTLSIMWLFTIEGVGGV